jgi:hypothetical protein
VPRSSLLIAASIAAAVFATAAAAQIDTYGQRQAVSPPSGLSIYGRTLWNLEALLHDTFGKKTSCIRWRDYAFVSASCGDLAHYGYWQDIFGDAHDSRFKLIHLAHAPMMGNAAVVTVKGLYVSCGNSPGWGALAHAGSRTRRWLVVVHGWAMTPFICLGE